MLEKGEGGDRKRDWNILYHLGGNGPWIEKVDGNDSDGIKPPDGCAVEQVHLVCCVHFMCIEGLVFVMDS